MLIQIFKNIFIYKNIFKLAPGAKSAPGAPGWGRLAPVERRIANIDHGGTGLMGPMTALVLIQVTEY